MKEWGRVVRSAERVHREKGSWVHSKVWSALGMVAGCKHRILQAGCSRAGDEMEELVMVDRRERGNCLLEPQPIVATQVPDRECFSLWTDDSKRLEEEASLHPPWGSLESTGTRGRVEGKVYLLQG